MTGLFWLARTARERYRAIPSGVTTTERRARMISRHCRHRVSFRPGRQSRTVTASTPAARRAQNDSSIEGFSHQCALLLKNDCLVSIPSELPPRITKQNRNGIDTGGTPGVRNYCFAFSGAFPVKITNFHRAAVCPTAKIHQ